MQPATRSDAVRLQLTGSDVVSLRVAGTLSGVVVLAAGGSNGPGIGRLISSIDANGNPNLAWQGPGSATPGAAQLVAPDSTYLLEDGANPACYVRVAVYSAYLPQVAEARVFLGDRYNELGPDDVNAANAAAGIIETTQYTLTNVSVATVNTVKLWINRSGLNSRGITVSSDNVSYFNPASEGDPNVLTWASIAPGASVNVWMRRTVPAATPYSPARTNELRYGWNGI